MRTALCLSGQARFAQESFSLIKRNILDLLNPDVFIHTWDTTMPVMGMFPEKLVELYRPKGFIIEPQRIFPQNELKFSDFVNLQNEFQKEWMFQRIHSMFYSIHQSNLLKKDFEMKHSFRYDLVIRGRTDTDVNVPFPKEEFIKEADLVYCHKYPFNERFPFCLGDQWAYGTSINMDLYSSVFSDLAEYTQDLSIIHPGCLLTYHLTEIHGIETKSNSFVDALQDKLLQSSAHIEKCRDMEAGRVPKY